MRVLVVDDEVGMRLFMRTLFDTDGHEAVLARNGQEGLELARTCRPDIIILDVMMPQHGGLLLYRELKADPALAGIPVIMLSGVKGEVFSHAMLLCDMTEGTMPPPEAYVEKPPHADELLALAEHIVAQKTLATAISRR